MTRRSLIVTLPFVPVALEAMPRLELLHVFDAGLRDRLINAVREYDPDGGDFGRGPRIKKSQVPGVSIILAEMGFKPYVWDSPDEFGQAFPLYGCSGGLTTLAYRVWTRERDGKHECVPIEYNNEERLS